MGRKDDAEREGTSGDDDTHASNADNDNDSDDEGGGASPLQSPSGARSMRMKRNSDDCDEKEEDNDNDESNDNATNDEDEDEDDDEGSSMRSRSNRSDDDCDESAGDDNDDSNASNDDSNDDEDEREEGADLPRAAFHRGDRVYAQDGKRMYAAIVRHASIRQADTAAPTNTNNDGKDEWSYRTHFIGWNSKWDRWIPESDLMADTPEARRMAEHLREQEVVAKIQKQEKVKTRKDRAKRKQLLAEQLTHHIRAVMGGQEDKEDQQPLPNHHAESSPLSSLPLVDNLPFTLKTILLDERDKITKPCFYFTNTNNNITTDQQQQQFWHPGRVLPCLPASVTITSALLGHFMKHQIALLTKSSFSTATTAATATAANAGETALLDDNDNNDEYKKKKLKHVIKEWKDTILALIDLFNNALPLLLLYDQERLQYISIQRNSARSNSNKQQQKERQPCDLYGCEHLLRLFIRFPLLVSHFSSDLLTRIASSSSSSSTILTSDAAMKDSDNNNDNRIIARKTRAAIDAMLYNKMDDIIRYLQIHQSKLFKQTYRDPNEDELYSAEKALRDFASGSASSTTAAVTPKVPSSGNNKRLKTH